MSTTVSSSFEDARLIDHSSSLPAGSLLESTPYEELDFDPAEYNPLFDHRAARTPFLATRKVWLSVALAVVVWAFFWRLDAVGLSKRTMPCVVVWNDPFEKDTDGKLYPHTSWLGYGGYLYYNAIARRLAMVGGCAFSPQPVWSRAHKYQHGDILNDIDTADVRLNGRMCIYDTNFFMEEFSTADKAKFLAGKAEEIRNCSLWVNHPKTISYWNHLAECGPDIRARFHRKFKLIERPGTVAVHMRLGDMVNGNKQDVLSGRVLREEQINAAVAQLPQQKTWDIEILAQGYSQTTFPGLDFKHTVNNNSDIESVMLRMMSAEIFIGAVSGFINLPLVVRKDKLSFLSPQAVVKYQKFGRNLVPIAWTGYNLTTAAST